jgi:hypothetical protein
MCLVLLRVVAFAILCGESGHSQARLILPFDKIYWGQKIYAVQIKSELHNPDCPTQCAAITICRWSVVQVSDIESDSELIKDYVYHELGHIVTNCADDDHTTLHKSIYTLVLERRLLADKRNAALRKWMLNESDK